MLMQVNAFRTSIGGRPPGNWTTVGVNSQEELLQNVLNQSNATRREKQLAGLFVEGYCQHRDPMYFFSQAADPLSRQAVHEAYPDIVANFTGLQGLASRYGDENTALKNEFSIHADRVADIKAFYPGVYPVAAGDKAVVITTAGQTFPPLLYQCPSGATAVRALGNPDQLGSLSPSGNHECLASCRPSHWYLFLGGLVEVQGGSGQVERVPENRTQIEAIIGHPLTDVFGRYASVTDAEHEAVRQVVGGRNLDYVKTCG